MGSGNSGSLQSSSGGEDDFESPLSALLRPTPSHSAAGAFSYPGSLYGLQEFTSAPPPPQQQQQTAPWSSQFMAGASASSSSPRVAPTSVASMRPVDPSATQLRAMAAPAPARGSRKRARASRRAPTTVLTTDTSNFRAMVQEFTGIPSPPFGAGAGGPAGSIHSRFDHFFPSPSTGLRSATGVSTDPASSMPPYLLRPFAQKLQTQTTPFPFPSFASPSSSTPPSSNMNVANANVTMTATDAGTTTASANQRSAAGDDFQLTSSALLRMQDHDSYLSFQNILGTTQPMFGSFSHANPRLHEQPSSEFLSGIGGQSIGLTHSGMMVSEGMHLHPRNDAHLGGDELSGVVSAGSGGGPGSCKLKYSSHAGASSSSATANADRPPDGAAGAPSRARPARGEGLDPWICTSE